MARDPDPFRHHPYLREIIVEPLGSFYRTFTFEEIDARRRALGLFSEWRASDAEIEASHRAFLATLVPEQDLWVFGYGSLMWDPAFCFSEVRRARAPHHARRFILKDVNGARGTAEAPGLMAALDDGAGCDGLVFRIAAADVARESWFVWRREMIAFSYKAALIGLTTAFGPVTALTFVANHETDSIAPHLTREEQVRYIATGRGSLGSSLQYIENVARHLAAIQIHDADVLDLLAEATLLAQHLGEG